MSASVLAKALFDIAASAPATVVRDISRWVLAVQEGKLASVMLEAAALAEKSERDANSWREQDRWILHGGADREQLLARARLYRAVERVGLTETPNAVASAAG